MSLGSDGGRSVCLWRCCLLVVVCCRCHWESRSQEGGGIAQAWATWPEGASAPNGSDVLRAWSTRDGDTGNEANSSYAGFLNLTNCHGKRLGKSTLEFFQGCLGTYVWLGYNNCVNFLIFLIFSESD